jgi:hypothetical protein
MYDAIYDELIAELKIGVSNVLRQAANRTPCDHVSYLLVHQSSYIHSYRNIRILYLGSFFPFSFPFTYVCSRVFAVLIPGSREED